MDNQTYTEKVLNVLRDDGHESLSFKDVDNLTPDEIKQILPIACVYGEWLDALKLRAVEVFGEEVSFIEHADKIDKLYNDMIAFCKKVGIE